MSNTAEIVRRLRDANPAPADLPMSDAEWSSAVLLDRIDLRAGAADAPGAPGAVHRPAHRQRGPLIAIGAAFAVVVVVGAVGLASSTNTDSPPATTPTTIETPPTTEAAIAPVVPRTIEIEAFDYGYSGFDTDFKVGDTLALFNSSKSEYHSLIVVKFNDDYPVKTIEEIVALDPQDIWDNKVVNKVGRPLHAAPGMTGNARIRLQTPGTYIALDWIPQNADADAMSQGFKESGLAKWPPFNVAGGPLGYQHGMIIEFIVTE